jgi:predicted transcriptional regulator
MSNQQKTQTFGMILRALLESNKFPHELVDILHRSNHTVYHYLSSLLEANKIRKIAIHKPNSDKLNRGRPKIEYELIDETGWDVVYA